jgi:hypothetical protein
MRDRHPQVTVEVDLLREGESIPCVVTAKFVYTREVAIEITDRLRSRLDHAVLREAQQYEAPYSRLVKVVPPIAVDGFVATEIVIQVDNLE